jgi:glycine cleavage system regulatory protein
VEVDAQIAVVVEHVTACAKAIAAVGVNVEVDAKAKVDLVAKVATLFAVCESGFAIHDFYSQAC